MGMASSQVRLLAITNRMHDIEYKAQCLQNAKLALATLEDEVYEEYQSILNATTLTVDGKAQTTMPANFKNLCANGRNICCGSQYAFVDNFLNAMILDNEVYNLYKNNSGLAPEELALMMVGGASSNFKGVWNEIGGDSVKDNIEKLKNNESLYQSNGSQPLNRMIKFLQDPNHKIKTVTGLDDKTVLADDIEKNAEGDGGDTFATKKAGDSGQGLYELDQISTYDENQILEILFLLAGDDDRLGDDYGCNNIKLSEIKFEDDNDTTEWKKIVNEFTSAAIKNSITGVLGEYNEYNAEKHQEYQDLTVLFRAIDNFVSGGGQIINITMYNNESAIGNASEDSEWMLNQQSCGRIGMLKIDGNTGKLTGTSIATDKEVHEKSLSSTAEGKAKVAKAEAEYEHKCKQIDRKDKQYDTELSKLEAERNALDTEREGLKKVIQDNVERTFGLFS